MWAIACHTLYKVKEPAFVLLLFVGALLAWFTKDMGCISLIGEGIHRDNILIGTVIILSFGVVVALLVGATEIPKDMDANMIAIFLGKSLKREAYILGKVIGVAILIVSCSGFWLTLLLLSRYCFTFDNAIEAMSFVDICSQYFSLLLLLPVCALAICTSCLFGDLGAMIFSFIYMGCSLLVSIVPYILKIVPKPINYILEIPYYLVPNVMYFVSSLDVIGFLYLVMYALVIGMCFVLIAQNVFNKAEL